MYDCLPLCGRWVFELRTPCLHSKFSYTLNHLPDARIWLVWLSNGCLLRCLWSSGSRDCVCTRQQAMSWVGRIEEIFPVLLVRIYNLSLKAMKLESIPMSYPQHGWKKTCFFSATISFLVIVSFHCKHFRYNMDPEVLLLGQTWKLVLIYTHTHTHNRECVFCSRQLNKNA